MGFPSPPTVESIVAAQNADGGWGYVAGGRSWTEPTVYALLTQSACGRDAPSIARGTRWLLSLQREDGGWPPCAGVDESTWVTAQVVLLLVTERQEAAASRAVRWLCRQNGRESSFFYRLRMRLLGAEVVPVGGKGWPWYPETAAWVSPTAVSILALERYNRRRPSPELTKRIESGRQYLLSRMCSDGGWNHGASKALGYEAGSYPETTGMALLALRGVEASRLNKSYAAAERHLRACRTAQGIGWLQLGLQAHSRKGVAAGTTSPVCHTLVDACVWLLASSGPVGINVFLG